MLHHLYLGESELKSDLPESEPAFLSHRKNVGGLMLNHSAIEFKTRIQS